MHAIKVKLFLGNEIVHTYQLLIGLEELKKQGVIDLTIAAAQKSKAANSYCTCIVNEKKIVFDFHDRPTHVNAQQYEWSDFYFKRTITKDVAEKYSKALPYGLNVFYDPPASFGWHLAKHKPTVSEGIKVYASSKTWLNNSLSLIAGNFLKLKNRRNGISWSSFQQAPIFSKHPQIIFVPRIWNIKHTVTGAVMEDRYVLNNERITCVKALKKNFAPYYNGGVEDTPDARSLCPELVMPLEQTHKINYIKQLQAASIGISTVGLAYSIGWKFSEYMLFSKAIVSNDLSEYLFNHPIEQGRNYSSFSNEDNFLTAVETLIRNDEFRFEMMQRNYEYSQEYLMPQKQLMQAFIKAGIC